MKKNRRFRLGRITFKLGWHKAKHDNWITGRVHHLLIRRAPWWDWGHRVMILVGTCIGGNYDAPEPPTWWYRLGPPKRMWRTRFPRHPLSTYEVIKGDYNEFRRRTDGLNEDQMYEWQAIGTNQDEELILGHRFWGGNFYGMRQCDVALLRKYLRAWRRRDWYGLRSWIYYQALHAAVHRRRPLSCQATPSRDSGGYDHWHCQLRKRHAGPHKYNLMTWHDGEPVIPKAQSDAIEEHTRMWADEIRGGG